MTDIQKRAELESKLDTYEAVKMTGIGFTLDDEVDGIFAAYDKEEVVGLLDDLIDERTALIEQNAELIEALEAVQHLAKIGKARHKTYLRLARDAL